MNRKLASNKTSFKKGHHSYSFKNELGNKYGKLIVLKREKNTKFGTARWLCQCDCGKTKIINAELMRLGKTKSCGCILSGKKRSGEAPMLRSFRSYKHWSEKRNLVFEISYLEFKQFIFLPCYYCNELPQKRRFAYHRTRYSKGINTDEGIVFHGIDRKNNLKGYIKKNIVTCCTICNGIKSDLPLNEFKNKISKIFNNLKNI